MKKFFLLPFLFALTLGFISCSDDDDKSPVWYFYDEPAIVKSVSAGTGSPEVIIQTAYGNFSVPELSGSLAEGQCLWTAFTYDMNNQPSPGVMTATAFRYKEIDSTKVLMPADKPAFDTYLEDSYSDSIKASVLYLSYVNKVLFFGFSMHDSKSYGYELICNPDLDEGSTYPTLYIRARPFISNIKYNSLQTDEKNTVHYGFDMTGFLDKYMTSGNSVTFNLKYKTGTKDGKDVYKSFKDNPITWSFK